MSLIKQAQRLKAELFRAGGATVDTPPPPDGPADTVPIGARTVIQPDGDILVLLDEQSWPDAGLRALHGDRVSAWFEQLETTVTTTVVLLRRAGILLASLVVVASGAGAWQAASAVTGAVMLGVGLLLGVVAQGCLRLAAGQALRRQGVRR